MSEEKVRTEEFRIDGDRLVGKVKELVRKGNIRRVVIKNSEGHPLIDIPLTWGVVGSVVAPQLAALGAIAALIQTPHSLSAFHSRGRSPIAGSVTETPT